MGAEGSRKYQVHLTDEQRAEMNRRAHYKSIPPSTRDRLEMVRLSDAGWRVPKIASHLSQHEYTVRRWIKTFLSSGFEALVNKSHLMHVSYEAPQGRRMNIIGGYFSHGPMKGEFHHQSFASLPKLSLSTTPKSTTAHSRGTHRRGTHRRGTHPGKQRKSIEQQAVENGLRVEEVGPIDAGRFLAFLWKLSGRDVIAPSDWKRARPLVVVLDNYFVHHSQLVKDAREALEAADIFLFYLPSYSPKLSRIEPIWNDTKQHYLSERSQEHIARLKAAVDEALTRKAAVDEALTRKAAVDEALTRKAAVDEALTRKAASLRLRERTPDHTLHDSTIRLRRAA